MARLCYIMRGVPGSGKSTVAKSLALGHFLQPENSAEFWWKDRTYCFGYENLEYEEVILSTIHSTDSYFYDGGGKFRLGEYKFNPSKLGLYHTANFKAFRDSCEARVPIVICDNTNISKKEWKRYAVCAEDSGYIVAIVSMPLPTVKEAVERNSHGVPAEAIERMIKRWSEWDGKI